jgi:hypothetical protein
VCVEPRVQKVALKRKIIRRPIVTIIRSGNRVPRFGCWGTLGSVCQGLTWRQAPYTANDYIAPLHSFMPAMAFSASSLVLNWPIFFMPGFISVTTEQV